MRHPAVILHLSHTDIRCDARILRQLDALRHLSGVRVAAIGVESGEDAARGAHDDGVRIETVRVMSKQFTLLPRPLRYVINLCELVCRVLPRAVLHRPSVVHCHDTLVLPLGWVTSLLTGAALVYDAHELECHKSGQGRLLSSGTAILEWFCWSQVSLLISVSPAIIDWYQQRYGSKRSVLVLNSPLLSSPAPTKTGRMDIEGRSARYFLLS